MKSPIDLIGGFYTVDGLNWSCQDTVNYLPVAAGAGGTKTPAQLKSAPGLKPFAIIGDGPEHTIRGMHDAEGQLFVVAGRTLYQLMTTTGVAIPLGSIPGVGRVSISHNQVAGGNQVTVVNGQSGYVYNTRTQDFRRITDAGYPGAFDIDFIDGYMVQVEPFGRYVFHSQLADALDYNTLDRFEAESQPDRIVSILVANDEVRVFGARSTQIFVNTGAAQGTFQSKGITIDRGCAGRFTPCRLDNGVYFLGDDGVVYQDYGYSPVRISTHAIEEAISNNDWSQAFAFTWTSQGHSVYYLTFPDGQTWGYDVASKLWHRRSSYHPVHEVSRRWRLNSLVFSNGKWYGGDSTSGRIYTVDWDYMMEGDGDPLVSERVSQTTYGAGNNFTVSELDLVIRTGESATVPVSFQQQPPSPTIEGTPPTAFIGQTYPAFAFDIGGGTGQLTVSIRSGTLPSGISMSTLGVLSGTPTESGSFPVVVRVTDANMLFADHEANVRIMSGVTMATNLRHYTGVPESLTPGAADIPWLSGVVIDVVCLSAKGDYMVGSDADSSHANRLQFMKYNSATDAWVRLPRPAQVPSAGPTSFSWSPDNKYLAVGVNGFGADRVWVYKLEGDTLSKIAQPSTLQASQSWAMAWSDDGTRLAASNGSTSDNVWVYNFDPATGILSGGRGGISNGDQTYSLAWVPLSNRWLIRANSVLSLVDCSGPTLTTAAEVVLDGAYSQAGAGSTFVSPTDLLTFGDQFSESGPLGMWSVGTSPPSLTHNGYADPDLPVGAFIKTIDAAPGLKYFGIAQGIDSISSPYLGELSGGVISPVEIPAVGPGTVFGISWSSASSD